jgi:hypothetical protein
MYCVPIKFCKACLIEFSLPEIDIAISDFRLQPALYVISNTLTYIAKCKICK